MRTVNFEKVSIKNFLSVGEERVNVDFRPGIHIITGINKDKQDRRNGVGKSTIADAIHFARLHCNFFLSTQFQHFFFQ